MLILIPAILISLLKLTSWYRVQERDIQHKLILQSMTWLYLLSTIYHLRTVKKYRAQSRWNNIYNPCMMLYLQDLDCGMHALDTSLGPDKGIFSSWPTIEYRNYWWTSRNVSSDHLFECRQQQHLMTLWLRLIVLYDLKIISEDNIYTLGLVSLSYLEV